MSRAIFSFGDEPQGLLYSRILDYASSACALGLVVVRPDNALEPRALEVLQRLGTVSIKTIAASEWPGTQLIGHTAFVHYFRYNREARNILKEAATALFQWVQPALPEDLCLLRQNEDPWLVSISHERDAYLALEESEFSDLVQAVPGLRGMLRREE